MAALSLIYAQMRQAQERIRILDNAARTASHTSQHQTQGAGWMAPSDPLMFSTRFATQPAVFHGSWLQKPPDYKYYKYPQITGGVTSWVIQDGLWVGAHLFFSVLCEPITPPRTNGSNAAALSLQLGEEVAGTPSYFTCAMALKEAQLAVYLLAHPAQVVVQHHLLFMATGLKGMPGDVESELNSDVQITPLVPPIYSK